MERQLIVCCGSLASPSMFQISLSWLSYCPGWNKWLPETSEINPAAVNAIITFNDMCETVQVSEEDRRKCNLLCASTKKTKGLRHRLPKKSLFSYFLSYLCCCWKVSWLHIQTVAHTVYLYICDLHIFTPSVLQICSDISHAASLSSLPLHFSSLLTFNV